MSEYIITKEQIEELNRKHGGMEIVTSWLSCYAIWDTSSIPPVMKSEHVAVDLPEIVRCRDCVNYVPSDVGIGDDWCVWWGSVCPSGEGFCAWGDREGERAGTIQPIQPITTRWEETRDGND